MRCSVTPTLEATPIAGYWGSLAAICLEAIEFAPRVRTSRNAKNITRGGKDQSGSQEVSRSALQRIIGSALPNRAINTRTRGAESRVPFMIDRAREEDTERGAPDASRAVAPATRRGARIGTATSSLAESSLQLWAPRVMVASPSSIASLTTIRT